jgi:CRISPR-associated endonuclease/helicase Cas3
LLTATPEEACDIALNTLEKNGVKIKRIDGKENSKNLIPSQTPVNLTIRQQPDTKEQLISEISKSCFELLEDDKKSERWSYDFEKIDFKESIINLREYIIKYCLDNKINL